MDLSIIGDIVNIIATAIVGILVAITKSKKGGTE